MSKYCLKNISGVKLKPLCMTDQVKLSNDSYKRGYRVTGNTLGLSRGIGARKIHIINEFNVIKKKDKGKSVESSSGDEKKPITIILVFEGLIKSTSMNSIVGDKIVLSVNLQMMFIKKNGTYVRDYFLENELDEMKKKINLSIIPILRNLEMFNIDILKMVGIDSGLLIKQIVFNLMKGKMRDVKIEDTQSFELFEPTMMIQVDK